MDASVNMRKETANSLSLLGAYLFIDFKSLLIEFHWKAIWFLGYLVSGFDWETVEGI